MTVVDFEHERADRLGRWTLWADRAPADNVVIRLRGDIRLSGDTATAPPNSRYVLRGQALCLIEPSGSLHLVAVGRTARDKLEWMPG